VAGGNPNGTWSLYVVDDAAGDIGNFNGGWSLTFTKLTPVCNTDCAGAPRISTTTTFSCAGGNTVATITVSNSGTATANNVVLTTAKIGAVSGTPLPQNLGNLAAGASAVTTVTFSGAPSGSQTVTVGGTFTGGTYNSARRVPVPSCALSLVVPSSTYQLPLPASLAAVVAPLVLTGR
jgi:hypothetical protein